ncbi:MAG TPA: nickel-dependent hydrogenase large subunit [Candidatus Krumholzibacteriaceae bacterium]|nr:nickel-dependent hydrogenase large subunit [Candidatus Krumholzibacteriaceae bacterium]
MSEREFVIPIGPQHPALKEPESFLFTVDGEVVVDVEARIGYNHRGIEKAMESRNYIQNLYITERVCGICSNAHQTAYTGSVEEAGGIEIPERAKYIRVFIQELERLHSHLLWVGVAAHEIGFDTMFYYVWRDRELVMDLLEEISGNRVNYAMPTVGGVRRDLNKDNFTRYHKILDTITERTNYYIKVASTEKTILERAVGVGYLGKEDMIRLSGCGPNARSSGVPCDIRKISPYLIYDEIPFEHIYVDNGDVLGQVLVRVLETLESVKICKWVLDNIPDGEIAVKFNPMQRLPEGEAAYIVEAQRGELIHYTISDGKNMPYRHKIRAPTMANIPSLIERLKGGYIADIPITLAGIDPCFSCTDRMVFYDEGKDKTWTWTEGELSKYRKEWYSK